MELRLFRKRGPHDETEMAATCRRFSKIRFAWVLRNSIIKQNFHPEKRNLYTVSVCLQKQEESSSSDHHPITTGDHNLGKFKNSFGYVDGKRDKSMKGSLYLNMIQLPPDLKDSYKIFCKRYPKKTVTEDGQKLARHLRNRGRPTERSWQKFKESNAKLKTEVKHFSVGDEAEDNSVYEHGLVGNEELTKEDLIDPEYEDDDHNMKNGGNEGIPLKRERRKKTEVPKKASYTVVRYGKREIAAFAASRIPACFGTTKRALGEIKRRDPDFHPKALLDFGSGTGTAVWAANDLWGDSLREYQCIDVSEDSNNACEFLLRGSKDPSQPMKVPGVYFRRFLPLSNKVTYDVVISAYTLSELPFKKQRQFALSNLWSKADKYLVIVEHGNNEGFEIALQARNYVTKGSSDVQDVFTGFIETDQGLSEDEYDFVVSQPVDPGYVFAPCPHDTACPRSEVDVRDHPCNFEQKVELAFSQRNTTLKRWGYATERFSFLILKKGERNCEESSMPRVLHPPKRRKNHVICDICNSNGNIEQYIFTRRKDPDLYKGIRHCVKWGDLMPDVDNKIAKKIITFENEVIRPSDEE